MSDNDNKQWFQKEDKRVGANNQNKRPNSSQKPSKNSKKTDVHADKKRKNVNKAKTVNKSAPKNAPVGQKTPGNVSPVKKSAPVTKKKKKKLLKAKKEKKQVQTSPVVKQEVVPVDPKTKKRRKTAKIKGLKIALISVVVVLFAVGVMYFAVHHLFNYFAVKPEMAFIEKGSIEHTIGARALIVRDEQVIATNATGDLVTQATEGSRVYAGQNVAMVVPEDMQNVVYNLRNTQSQISEVQQELIAEGSAPGADSIYSEINSNLVPIVDMIRLDSMEGNVSDMASYMSSIQVLLNQRESELSELEFDDERLRVLRADESSYENQLRRSSATITTNNPGIISFKLDGLETELTYDALLDMEPDVIKDYINSSTGLITSDLYIESNENVARIASNEHQYIAVYLKSRDASVSDFQVGTLHTLNVSSEGVSIGKCVVERCVTMDGGMLIVFSTTHYVEDLLDLRTVDIEIVITETSGLRIAASSLVNPDYERGVASIYVNNQGFADEIPVIIEDYDREFVIISPIGDNHVPNTQSVIIVNPESIQPGEKVDK